MPFTYTVSAGALPEGLSLNASTCAPTGTPTAAGAYSFTIQATDTITKLSEWGQMRRRGTIGGCPLRWAFFYAFPSSSSKSCTQCANGGKASLEIFHTVSTFTVA